MKRVCRISLVSLLLLAAASPVFAQDQDVTATLKVGLDTMWVMVTAL